MSFIEFKNICKKYAGNDKNSVTDFNLDIEEKEFIAFVGPSGCGKSTTLRMIAGFEEITSGDLFIDGKRVNEVAPADRGISMVFQNYALYPHMTVAFQFQRCPFLVGKLQAGSGSTQSSSFLLFFDCLFVCLSGMCCVKMFYDALRCGTVRL